MDFTLKPLNIDFSSDYQSIVASFNEGREGLSLLLSLNAEMSDEEFLNTIAKLYNCHVEDFEKLIMKMLGTNSIVKKRMQFNFPNIGSEEFTVYGHELTNQKYTVYNMPFFCRVLQEGYTHPNDDLIIITGWSSTPVGRKLLNSGAIPENMTLYKLLGAPTEISDLEFYAPLIIPLIRKIFQTDRIITDTILYIKRLKKAGVKINSIMENERNRIKSLQQEFYTVDTSFSTSMANIAELANNFSLK